MADDQVLTDMLTMLDRSPGVLALRVCVIELLIERERYADALAHCGTALGQEPGNAQVLALMMRCTTALSGGSPAPATTSVAVDSAAAEARSLACGV